MNKKIGKGCAAAAALMAFLGFCLATGFTVLGVRSFRQQPRAVTGFNFGAYALEEYYYSSQQQAIVDIWGDPHSFTILFYEREDPQGRIETIRHEEWSYPLQDTSVTFENGEEISRASMPGAAEIYPTRYSPGQFLAFMNREQLAALTGLADWFILPVDEDLVADAELYYASGLTFALQDGELVFVDAVYFVDGESPAVEQPSGESPARVDPAETDFLTPEEAACEGTHTYSGVFYVDGTGIDEETVDIQVSFNEDTVTLIIDVDTMQFTRVVANQYVLDDTVGGSSIYLNFTTTGLTLIFTEEGSDVQVIFTKMDTGGQ